MGFEGLPASFHVFPLHTPVEGGCSCRRDDCRNVGKHPRTMNGLKDATNDQAQIDRWWKSWPGANVGVACGPSGIVVIDIDPRHDGDESLRDLIEGKDWPDTPTVLTGGGGVHYYFKAPPDVVIRNSSSLLGPGIDVRGEGGYVVAPPSWHESGRQYEWETGLAPGDIKAAYLPDWLSQLLTTPGSRGSAPTAIGAVIPAGKRDETLTSLAGSMRRRGMGEGAILAALREVNVERCVPPLADRDVQRIAKSVARYAPSADIRVKTTGGITTYQRLRRHSVTPPLYTLDIDGDDVQLTTKQLLMFSAFRVAVFEQLNRLMPLMKQQEWEQQVETLISEEIEILPDPEDASELGALWYSIRQFLGRRSDDIEQFEAQKAVEADGLILTNGAALRAAIRQHGFNVDQRDLWRTWERHGGFKQSVRITPGRNGKQVWAWAIPVGSVDESTEGKDDEDEISRTSRTSRTLSSSTDSKTGGASARGDFA